MKCFLIILLSTFSAANGYLSFIRLDNVIASESTGNTIKCSNRMFVERAANVDLQFTPLHVVEINIKGNPAYSGKFDQCEVDLIIEMTGTYRRRLFNYPGHIVCSESEMKQLIQEQLIKAVGDEGLVVKLLNVAYLEPVE